MPTCGRQSAICSWFSPSIYHVGPRNQSAHQAFFAFFNGFYPLNHCSGQKHYHLMTIQNSQVLKLLKLYMNYLYSLQQPYMTVQKNLFYQWREPWLRNITQSAWCNISVSVSLFLHAWVPLSNRPHTAAEALGRSQSCLEDTFSTTTWKLPALRIWPSETPFFTGPQ